MNMYACASCGAPAECGFFRGTTFFWACDTCPPECFNLEHEEKSSDDAVHRVIDDDEQQVGEDLPQSSPNPSGEQE